jgi:hypothetical protein
MKTRILYWAPRILTILAILFVSVFSLDCFEPGVPLGKSLLCFLVHNLPAWILTGVLLVAWKWETAGGVAFLILFMAMGVIFSSFTTNFASLFVIFPFAVTGALFILHDQLPQKG